MMKDKFLESINKFFDWLLGKDAVLVDADFDAKKKDNTPKSQPKTFVIIILIVTALTGVCLLTWSGVNMAQAALATPTRTPTRTPETIIPPPLVKVLTATNSPGESPNIATLQALLPSPTPGKVIPSTATTTQISVNNILTGIASTPTKQATDRIVILIATFTPTDRLVSVTPSVTPYPTYTPFPTHTFTPYPTYTPLATYTPFPTVPTQTPWILQTSPAVITVMATVNTHTPYPTYTPYATYTPYPTYTPFPSSTPTVTPSPTFTPTATRTP